jgi:hypothetical protein
MRLPILDAASDKVGVASWVGSEIPVCWVKPRSKVAS